MEKIGLLSDTHGFFDPVLKKFFKDCNEIWHAGDIGNLNTVREITSFKPLRAVYGNIDGQDIRNIYPLDNEFIIEEVQIWITHIGGYPGKYDQRVRQKILKHPPSLFISGHSHILKVMSDKKTGLLHINPGSAGRSGMHLVRTAVRFTIEKKNVRNLEVFELGSR